MRRRKKQTLIVGFLFLIMALSLGYALLTTNLNIEGIADIDSNTWNIYWDNVQVTTGSVTGEQVIEAPTIDSNKTTVSFHIQLKEPGEFYEFTVDVKNDGSVDAMIDTVTKMVNNSADVPEYLMYSVTYQDDAPITAKQKLNAGSQETYKVRIYYNPEISPDQLPGPNESLNLSFSVTYVQKDSSAIEIARFNVGDYIYIRPESTYSVIPASLSGASSEQHINPSQLTLWRVIAKNNDGTMEAVSEYLSPEMITIGGITGYANYIDILQTIAAEYRNSCFIDSTRAMGYDGQTKSISDVSSFNGTTINPPSTTSTPRPTTGSGEEFQGGVLGDTLYLRDYQLVSNVYKSDTSRYGNSGLVAYKADTPNSSYYYWIASRQYYYNTSSARFDFSGSSIGPSGTISGVAFRSYYYGWSASNGAYCIRPIITIKPYIRFVSGEGTMDNPYELDGEMCAH